MKKEIIRKNNCRICNSDKCEFIFNLEDYRYCVDKKKFSLVKCLKCGFISLDPLPDSDELQKYFMVPEYYN